MTRWLEGHRGKVAGALLCLVALAVVFPALALAAFRDVDIVDDEFRPPEIIVERGDTVVWVHRGVRPHGVRATDGSFDSSPGCSFQDGASCMRSGDRYSRTFDQPGTFAYFCPVHGGANGIGMTGQITVSSGGGGGGGATTTAPPPPPTTQTTRSSTTMRPPTTAATTTESPSPTTTPGTPPGPELIPADPDILTIPGETSPVSSSSTTLGGVVAGEPIVDGADDDGNTLLLIAAVVVLAAAISASAWYFRPGARPPAP